MILQVAALKHSRFGVRLFIDKVGVEHFEFISGLLARRLVVFEALVIELATDVHLEDHLCIVVLESVTQTGP